MKDVCMLVYKGLMGVSTVCERDISDERLRVEHEDFVAICPKRWNLKRSPTKTRVLFCSLYVFSMLVREGEGWL